MIKYPRIMPFGKYKGYPIEDLPTDYLEWALREWEYNERNESLLTEIANQLAARRGEGIKR